MEDFFHLALWAFCWQVPEHPDSLILPISLQDMMALGDGETQSPGKLWNTQIIPLDPTLCWWDAAAVA